MPHGKAFEGKKLLVHGGSICPYDAIFQLMQRDMAPSVDSPPLRWKQDKGFDSEIDATRY